MTNNHTAVCISTVDRYRITCHHVLKQQYSVDNDIGNDAKQNDTPKAKRPDDAWKEGKLEHTIQAAIGREPETDGCRRLSPPNSIGVNPLNQTSRISTIADMSNRESRA